MTVSIEPHPEDVLATFQFAIRTAFANTAHIHRMTPDAAELIVREITNSALDPANVWALRDLGHRLAPPSPRRRLTAEELEAIARAQAIEGPQPGQDFAHYQGDRYRVVARALREDTLEPVVIYRSHDHGFTWDRTLASFTGQAEVAGVPVPRFSRTVPGPAS